MKTSLTLVVLLSLLAPAIADCAISVSPSLSTDGSFTVSWSSHSGADEGYKLRQSINGGPFSSGYRVYSTSKSFTGKTPGQYRYKVSYCENLGHPDEYECYDTGYPIEAVVVYSGSIPQPDSLQDQMAYEYSAKIGDFNNDGLQDIYIQRQTTPGVPNGAIDRLLLRQVAGGNFQLTVPTSAQASSAAIWPTIQIEITTLDLNVDGFVDLATSGIASYITGAQDQILFSPAEVLIESPLGHAAKDNNFDEFVEQTAQWAENPNYFHENAVWVEEPGQWVPEQECELEYIWGQGWDWYCTIYWEWQDGEEYWSYDHFNQDALAFCTALEEMDNAGGMTPGSAQANAAQSALEGVFGTGVFNRVFATGPVDIEFPPIDTSTNVPWWRLFRVQMIWAWAAQIGGSTPSNLPIYRVVEPAELASIQACHCFEPAPGQQEIKQFWRHITDAMWYGQTGINNINYFDERMLVQVYVSKQVIASGFPGSEPGTLMGWVSFQGPSLAALNAEIASKPIKVIYVWDAD